MIAGEGSDPRLEDETPEPAEVAAGHRDGGADHAETPEAAESEGRPPEDVDEPPADVESPGDDGEPREATDKPARVGNRPTGIGDGPAGIEHGRTGIEGGPAGIGHGRTGIESGPARVEHGPAEVGDGPAEASAPPDDADALRPVAAEPEPEPEPEDKRGPWAQVLGWSRSPAALLVGVLIGLLGFGLAVQVRSNTSTSGLPAARQEDLVRILDDLSSREDRLRRQIAELEAARTRLSTTGNSSSTALEEARKRSDALGILAGTVAAQGPGIQLTLTDPEHRLAAEDLLDTVEELRAAGAEAIQVGGVRIGLDSSFTSTDRGLAVDGVTVTAPYQIVAIGDPATLATAMEIPGGVADSTQRAGGQARTEQLQRVVIRALRAVRTPRYSQPTN
jgi:uncharacterized protein YlxW (UPF0749 family)